MAWGTSTSALVLWILSMVCLLGVIVLTVVYFVPTNNAFASGAIEVGAVSEKLKQWVSIHYARIAIALLGAVLGCLAIRS